MSMWKPDGMGWRARIGLVVPQMDIVPESELWTMAPYGVSVHCARIPLGVARSDRPSKVGAESLRAFADPPLVDEAVEALGRAPLHAIIYGFTSSSYGLGLRGDEALRERLERRSGGIPVVIACQAAIEALRALAVTRMALIDPPWFPDEATRLGAEYFRGAGFEVSYAAPAEMPVRGLPDGQRDVTPERLYEWVLEVMPAGAEAVFLGGNGFRTAAAIDALEKALGRPVLTANQVSLWCALCRMGIAREVSEYGRLFAMTPPTEP